MYSTGHPKFGTHTVAYKYRYRTYSPPNAKPVMKCIGVGVAIYSHLFIQMWVNSIKVQIFPATKASKGSLLMLVDALCVSALTNSPILFEPPTLSPHRTLLIRLIPEELVDYCSQSATAII